MQLVPSAGAHETAPLKIVVISDSFNANQQAKFIAERLATVLNPRAILISGAWQLEVLSSETCPHPTTAAETFGADLIIVSAHGEAELPLHFNEWLRNFVPPNRLRPSTLVALLDQEQETLPCWLSLRKQLSEIARDKQMQFLCPQDHWEQVELEYTPEDISRIRWTDSSRNMAAQCAG